jgi:DNA-binding LacI/PurR family transcriptional regulator
MSRKPTQKDIALAANVSQGLVSRILNSSHGQTGDAVRERVIAAARELGYSPRGKTEKRKTFRKGRTIVYIPPRLSTTGPGDDEVYKGHREFYDTALGELLDVASQKGCTLVMLSGRPGEDWKQRLAEIPVDGVIYHLKNRELAGWLGERFPMVEINQRLSADSDVVMSDPEEVIQMAITHLRQHGHERIAYATPPPSDYVNRRRRELYNRHLRQEGLPLYEEFYSFETLPINLYFSLPVEKRPTALITGTLGAISFQREALKKGLTLPKDLSLMGTDNIIHAATLAFVPLTTIECQMDQIARIAFNLLLNRLNEPDLVRQTVEIPSRLIIRESVCAPGDSAQGHQRSTTRQVLEAAH